KVAATDQKIVEQASPCSTYKTQNLDFGSRRLQPARIVTQPEGCGYRPENCRAGFAMFDLQNSKPRFW
ncbi:MAG: hypothetical protein ACE5K2_03150, partial [Candidatus Zixiibacteriota bacterium]